MDTADAGREAAQAIRDKDLSVSVALSEILTFEIQTDVEVRDAAKRELDMRIMPWGVPIESTRGTEEFTRGAFDVQDPGRVLLFPPEHEKHLALGHDGKPTMVAKPTGKGIAFEDREDGAYMTFRVARTVAGDEQLALAADGIVTGASVEMTEQPGGTVIESRQGRRHRRHIRSSLIGVSTTYNPAYKGAGIIAVRSAREVDMAEGQETVIVPAPEPVDLSPILARMDAIEQSNTSRLDAFMAQFQAREEASVELARSGFKVPSPDGDDPEFGRGDWASLVLRMLSGEKVSQREIEARVAAELITTDNLGVVPEQFLPEMIGIIDPSRPFLTSTRRLTTPRAGMTFNVPKIVTRPTVGVQAAEKDELASTTTSITDVSFNPTTIGGYGDISIQLLRRSDPSYLDLYLELLAEAYATMADDKAVDALLAASGLHDGGTVVADDGPLFGQAWANASAVSRRLAPDTIWMSSAAISAFIDAKSTTTNAPLYGNLAGAFNAAGGAGGSISGLRPVHVPALDDEAADIIVGPSRGFVWAEDGAITLQVDVPAKAGRDVALVGMVWLMPLYGAAFTKYAIGS